MMLTIQMDSFNMLYDDLKKVIAVVDGINTIVHCDIAERMVKKLARKHGMYHYHNTLLDALFKNRWPEYDPLISGMLDKIYETRYNLNIN